MTSLASLGRGLLAGGVFLALVMAGCLPAGSTPGGSTPTSAKETRGDTGTTPGTFKTPHIPSGPPGD